MKKYRIYSKTTNEFLGNKLYTTEEYLNDLGFKNRNTDNIILCEYIEKIDRTGKEICENDVVLFLRKDNYNNIYRKKIGIVKKIENKFRVNFIHIDPNSNEIKLCDTLKIGKYDELIYLNNMLISPEIIDIF